MRDARGATAAIPPAMKMPRRGKCGPSLLSFAKEVNDSPPSPHGGTAAGSECDGSNASTFQRSGGESPTSMSKSAMSEHDASCESPTRWQEMTDPDDPENDDAY